MIRSRLPGPAPTRLTKPLRLGGAAGGERGLDHRGGGPRSAPRAWVARGASPKTQAQNARRSAGSQAGGDLAAQPAGEGGELAEARLEHGLDAGLDLAGEHRGGAFGADGDHHRVAVDERGGEGVAEVGGVDDVGQDAGGPGLGGQARVGLGGAGGDEGEGGAAEQLVAVTGPA